MNIKIHGELVVVKFHYLRIEKTSFLWFWALWEWTGMPTSPPCGVADARRFCFIPQKHLPRSFLGFLGPQKTSQTNWKNVKQLHPNTLKIRLAPKRPSLGPNHQTDTKPKRPPSLSWLMAHSHLFVSLVCVWVWNVLPTVGGVLWLQVDHSGFRSVPPALPLDGKHPR